MGIAEGDYAAGVLLMLVALGLAIYGVVRIGRTLTPGQRIVLALVFALGLVCLALWLSNTGVLGRGTEGPL